MHKEASLKRAIKIQESPAPRYKYLKPHKYCLKLRWKVTRRITTETQPWGVGECPARGEMLDAQLSGWVFFFLSVIKPL